MKQKKICLPLVCLLFLFLLVQCGSDTQAVTTQIATLEGMVNIYYVKNGKLPLSNQDLHLSTPYTFNASSLALGWFSSFPFFGSIYSVNIDNGQIRLTGDLKDILRDTGDDHPSTIVFIPKISGNNIEWSCKGFRIHKDYEKEICTKNIQ